MEENNKNVNAQAEPVEEINAMLEDEPQIRDSKELQDSILEDAGMNGFQLWLAKMDDQKFKMYQWLFGAVMGIAAGVALFIESFIATNSQKSFSWGLIAAVVIALWGPKILEKRGLRRMPSLRIALAIGMTAMVIAFFLYTGFTTGWSIFTNK